MARRAQRVRSYVLVLSFDLADPFASADNNGLVVTLSPSVVNSLTAANPLGTGVQISPSGRPYTPPSEKPFKCSVPGCDKSYKQQNGLKYHRLHGHCNTNNFGKDGEDARAEGKPYVCHVASCGKRYKKCVCRPVLSLAAKSLTC